MKCLIIIAKNAIRFSFAEVMMQNAYLLTWNPKRWNKWYEDQKRASFTPDGTPDVQRWSCGKRKNLPVGSRVFLLRQGVEPKGIVGAGFSVRIPYEALHWEDERRKQKKTALYVDVQFERLLDPEADEPLPLSRLNSGRLANVNWNTQMSGIEIREAVEVLERLWQEHTRLFVDGNIFEEEPSAWEGESHWGYRCHKNRERWLRDAKLAAYQQAHQGGLPCEACGFDFAVMYGEIGRGYAQVHHTNPLSDRTRPSETNLSDLAVLCANCHVMVHRGGEVRPIKSLANCRQKPAQ